MHSVDECIEYLLQKYPEKLELAKKIQKEIPYHLFFKYMRLEDGLIDFLNWAKKYFYLAICTNRTTSTLPLLEHFNLKIYFNFVMTASQIPKNNPSALLTILEHFKINPEATLYIGDSKVDKDLCEKCKVKMVSFKNPNLSADFYVKDYKELKKIIEKILETQEENVKRLAHKYKDSKVFYFLGRGVNVATALEGRLKLLEIAYIPAIAYPAGESKHGPISLIEPGFPVIFVCPKGETYKATINNIMEMKARNALTIGIIDETDEEARKYLDDYIEIPAGVPEILSPIPYVVPLQLFAYYMALEKGLDPDKPRNLAKSVTVI